MADAFVAPRVRAMLICESVEELAEDEVFNLLGVRYYLPSDYFPFSPSSLWAYVLFSSVRKGRYPGLLSILNEQTGKILFMGKIEAVFEEDGDFLPTSVPITCSFPLSGEYRVQISFFQPALNKEDIVKAELPFWILGSE